VEYIKLLAERFRDDIKCAKENGERDKISALRLVIFYAL
jgi:hypothetical protein